MEAVAPSPKKTTKIGQVKEHLEQHGKITPWQAYQLYNYTRLADGVFTLKKRGMNIVTNLVTKDDSNGNPCTYAEYSYVKPKVEGIDAPTPQEPVIQYQ